MIWVPHRRFPQLPVNGSLNKHMAKQVHLFQTPVTTWLPMLANQRPPCRAMTIAGGSPKATQPQINFVLSCQCCSLLQTLVFLNCFIYFFCIMKAALKCLSNIESRCGVCTLQSIVGLAWMQLRLGLWEAFLRKIWAVGHRKGPQRVQTRELW